MNSLLKGIQLFNDADFFSAHDFFEEIWMGANSKDKLFFQGLTQISVGCFHLISGNNRGAKSQLSKGYQKLSQYSPCYYNVNLIVLQKELELLLTEIENKNLNNKTVDFSKIPVLKLTD